MRISSRKKAMGSVRSRRLTILLTLVLVFLPIFAVKLYIINFPARWTNEISFIWTRDFVRKEHKDNYRTVILGDSSTNAAFIPEVLGEDVINLAVVSNTPSDMYYIFKEYLEHNKAPDTVYIAFRENHFSELTGFMPGVEVRYFSLFSEFEYLFNILRLEKWTLDKTREYLSCKVISLNKYWPYLKNTISCIRAEKNKELLNKQTKHRGTFITRNVDVFTPSFELMMQYFNDYDNWRHFLISPLQDFYYRKLLGLCKENGMFVRILVIPIPFGNYGNNYWDEFISYHNEIMLDYEAFSIDIPSTLSKAAGGFSVFDFAEGHHMNNHGSLKFSRMIRSRYQDDFAKGKDLPVSDNTISGLEDYLQAENCAGKILQWLEGAGKDASLTALLFTRNGHKLYEDNDFINLKTSLDFSNGNKQFFLITNRIGGGNETSFSVSDDNIRITGFDDGKKINLSFFSGDKPFVFSSEKDCDLFILVFNSRTKKIVTQKSFFFSGTGYKIF